MSDLGSGVGHFKYEIAAEFLLDREIPLLTDVLRNT